MSIQYNTVQYHTPSIQYDMIQYSQHTIQRSTASYNEHTIRYDTVHPAYNTTQHSIIQRAYNTIRYDTVQHHTAGTCGRGCGSDNSDVDGRWWQHTTANLAGLSVNCVAVCACRARCKHSKSVRPNQRQHRLTDGVCSSVVFFLSVCSDRILRLHPRRGWRRVPDSARCIR